MLLNTLTPGAALAILRGAAAALYALTEALLLVYSSHHYLTLWRCWRRRRTRPEDLAAAERGAAALPSVTVQLPVYNERRVVARLIDAAAALDWPADRLEIQVLDDSDDETRAIAAAAVARHRARGAHIVHLHREVRAGYKAGALAAGLERARGEWLAVFDADFIPAPGFLRRAARHFGDPDVGMVQGRWAHLNRDRSLLTAAQATMLDAHFLLQHEARASRRLFFNFNGSAGVWRRACIEDAGGWSHDTLTEDLDLSYRAQLRGWRFAFDPGLEAPAELPAEVAALASQQRRWARGSIQTARKLLPAIMRSALPLPVKLEALIHLTNNVGYPLMLVLALLPLLPLPVLLGPPGAPTALAPVLQATVVLLGVVPVMAFLAAGQLRAGRRGRVVVRDVLAGLALGAGLSLNNARAVLDGLRPEVGEWERTPKTGDGTPAPGPPRYRASRGLAGPGELVLALYFAGLAALAAGLGELRAVPFVALLAAGYGMVGWGALRDRLATGRATAARE